MTDEKPCCKFWREQGRSSCLACAESTKGHNEFARRQARERDLMDELVILAKLANNPICKVCGKYMLCGQKNKHAVCDNTNYVEGIKNQFKGFVAVSKKEK